MAFKKESIGENFEEEAESRNRNAAFRHGRHTSATMNTTAAHESGRMDQPGIEFPVEQIQRLMCTDKQAKSIKSGDTIKVTATKAVKGLMRGQIIELMPDSSDTIKAQVKELIFRESGPSFVILELFQAEDQLIGPEADDYLGYLHDDAEELELAFAENLIEFGSTYKGTTSKGLNVHVLTLESNLAPNEKIYWFLALSDKERLLGHRTMKIKFSEVGGVKKASASGIIATRYRDLGIAPIIEMANLDTMQKLTNSLGEKAELVWRINNDNADTLKVMEDSLSSTDPLTEKRISEKRAEQKRWQTLYGNMGKIGAQKPAVAEPETEEVLEKRFLYSKIHLETGFPQEVQLTLNNKDSLDALENYSPETSTKGEQKQLQNRRLEEAKNALAQMKKIVKAAL